MKKNKIIGLGVCALALGVVAGAVSAKRALEVKATDATIESWSFVGSSNGWNMNTNVLTLKENVYSITLELAADVEFKIAANKNWNDCVLSWQLADLSNGHIGKDVGDGKNDIIKDAGIYTFTIKNTLTPTLASDWEHIGDYITIGYKEAEIIDDETEHDFKVVGSSAALGEWEAADGLEMTKPAGDGYLAKALNVKLDAWTKFKVVDVDKGKWYGVDGLYASDAAFANLTSDASGDFVVLNNTALDIYLRTDHGVAILNHGEELSALKQIPAASDGYYVLGLAGCWNPVFGVKDGKGQESANIAEFRNLALKAGESFKVVNIVAGEGTQYYGYDDLKNFEGASDMTGKIGLDPEDDARNLTVLADGTYSIYLYYDSTDKANKLSIVDENYEPEEDVYTVTIGGADPVELDENPKNPGEYMITGATLTKDAVISFKLNNEALAVAPKAGEGNNVALVEENLVIRMSGTGGIYLSQNESKWEVWVGGYVTPDVDVVDNFVATYITAKIDENWKTQDAATRAASCEAKYDAAKAALEKLTQAQQDLFAADERYGDARAKYEAWGVACGKITLVGNPSALKDSSNSGLIIALAATGLVAATGISIFFATRKKKAE